MTEIDSLVRRYVDGWKRRDRDVLESVLTPDAVAHGPGLRSAVQGRVAVVDALATELFELLDIAVHDLVVAGDRAAVRYVVRMRQIQPLLGLDPRDKEIHEHGMQFLAIDEGRIAEIWSQNDQVGFLGQLGIRELPEAMLAGVS